MTALVQSAGRISFTVPGKLVAKQAMRFTRSGQRYTDRDVVNYEQRVYVHAREAMGSEEPYDGPVAVYINVFSKIPASWSKKRKAAASWSTSKPDLDNVAKVICDGIKGVVLTDDKLIAKLSVEKSYGVDDRVLVAIETLPPRWHGEHDRAVRAPKVEAA